MVSLRATRRPGSRPTDPGSIDWATFSVTESVLSDVRGDPSRRARPLTNVGGKERTQVADRRRGKGERGLVPSIPPEAVGRADRRRQEADGRQADQAP